MGSSLVSFGFEFFLDVFLVRDFPFLKKKIKFRVLGVLFYVIFGNKKIRIFTVTSLEEGEDPMIPWEKRAVTSHFLLTTFAKIPSFY